MIRKLSALIVVPCFAFAADPSVTSTRIGAFDYQAQRSDGTTSNHQRPEIAALACANWLFQNPTGTCAVQGGKWAITVTMPAVVQPPAPTGSAALAWTAPTQRTDGTAITGALTYTVYHGPSATSLPDKVPVSGLSHVYAGLASGTHCFAVTATEAGAESPMSGVGCKVVP